MKDPAVGRTRAERALGENLRPSRSQDFRMAHTGQYDGPKASYGRYNVSEQASDIFNRQKRNMDMR